MEDKLTPDELFVISKLREFEVKKYADFLIEKRDGKIIRIVPSLSELNPHLAKSRNL